MAEKLNEALTEQMKAVKTGEPIETEEKKQESGFIIQGFSTHKPSKYDKLKMPDLRLLAKRRGITRWNTRPRLGLVSALKWQDQQKAAPATRPAERVTLRELKKMNVSELKEVCKLNGLKGYSKLPKPELLRLLKEKTL